MGTICITFEGRSASVTSQHCDDYSACCGYKKLLKVQCFYLVEKGK